MIFPRLIRSFHKSPRHFSGGEKSLLAILRKKTGYTFVNCKKALELNNNDVNAAEKWLADQAQALGWSKATKLEGRKTTQGLIGVARSDNTGVLLEANCETDFVARNAEFRTMVEMATQTCLKYMQHRPTSCELISKIILEQRELQSMQYDDGKPLADYLALLMGSVGENAILRRALCVRIDAPDLLLSTYVHPFGEVLANSPVQTGRVGGWVVIKETDEGPLPMEPDLAKNLCQHIVGMAPKRLSGDADDSLLRQEYLLEEDVSVAEVLEDQGVQVLDFGRYECGEQVEEPSAIGGAVEAVETCQ